MKASEQQALIPQEATPDTLIDLIGKWGGIHAITEAVYDCADLAQRILDMDDGDVEATVDPDTGEID